MIVPSKFNGYNRDGTRNLFMGGGGGGGPTQTTSTVTNSNIPGYAQPYVESMLGATQKQLFNTSQVQTGTDDQGNAIMGTQLDSFKPYQAYGGTYDAQGNQTAYDPTKGIAGFTPDQLKTQQGIMGLKTPAGFRTAELGTESVYNDLKTNQYTAPTNLGYTADTAKAATAGTSQNAVGSGYTASNAGSQGYTSRDATSQGYTSSDAAAIKAEAARLGVAPEAIAAQFKGPQDISSGIVSSGSPLTAFQMSAAQSQYAPTLNQYSMGAAPTVATKSFTDRGTAESYMSPYMQQVVDAQKREAQRDADIAGQAQGAQAARSGAFGGGRDSIMRAEAARNLATQKGNIQAQGLQSAFQQAQQQFNAEQGYGLQGQIANQQAGLTVGQQNLGAQLGIQQLGTQTGTQIALANLSNTQQAAVQNQAASLQAQGMTSAQALQAALANQSSGLQAAQANQGMAFNTAAQNAQLAQQAALANQSMKGQYGLTQGQFDQAANMQTSSQAQNAALANAAAKSAASQFGASAANQAQLANAAAFNQAAQFGAGAANTAALQNAAAASQASQFGAAAGNQASLANQAAANQMAQYNAGLGQQTALANQAAANQAAQFGAGQNLTSAQTAAQYGLAGNALQLQAAGQLGTLSGQELAAQQGILGMQSTVGAQQQALDQAAKNQAVQDYANAQQYPLMQLGTMSNMLRGLPMQASTTNQYAASPNPMSTAIGTIGAGASIYNATKPGGAAGGLPSEFKYAKGGIASVPRYDMGGEVESQLENMDEKGLAAQAKESSSPSIRRMAQRLLRERQMGNKPQGTGPMGVQYQAAQPQMPSYMPGGIVAFAAGDTVYGGPSSEEGGEEKAKGIDLAGRTMEQRLAMAAPSTPPAGGIMGASPVTQVSVAPAGPSPDVVKEAMRQRDLNTVQANRSTADVIKEIQAERDASGIGDNKAREEYRSQQMAERANMKDEQERQRHMRLAEFFASWGSTPGPVLVAGMNALKQSIPGLITDQKEAKKARREADKIIYDIDESTRLDKQGMHNEATARREKAAKYAEEYNKYLLTFQSQRESDKRALDQTIMTTDAQRDVANINARTQGGMNAQRSQEMMFANVDRALGIALNRQRDIEKDIEATRSKPPKNSPLADAMQSVSRYNDLLRNSKNDPSKVPEIVKSAAEQGQKVIDAFETRSTQRLQDAKAEVKRFEDIFTTQGRGSKSEKVASTSKDDPSDIMDILKQQPPASAASANAPASGTTKLANKPAKTTTEVPTNTLASNPYRETGRGRTGVDQGALQRDLQEYNELKDSKLSVAAGRRSFLEKKLRAAGALED